MKVNIQVVNVLNGRRGLNQVGVEAKEVGHDTIQVDTMDSHLVVDWMLANGWERKDLVELYPELLPTKELENELFGYCHPTEGDQEVADGIKKVLKDRDSFGVGNQVLVNHPGSEAGGMKPIIDQKAEVIGFDQIGDALWIRFEGQRTKRLFLKIYLTKIEKPEFSKTQKKVKSYRGFVISTGTEEDGYLYLAFTKEEWSMGKGRREPEFKADSIWELEKEADIY